MHLASSLDASPNPSVLLAGIAFTIRSRVRLNRSAWPLPRGFLTLVLVFLTSNILHSS